jgi:hypothetical protein
MSVGSPAAGAPMTAKRQSGQTGLIRNAKIPLAPSCPCLPDGLGTRGSIDAHSQQTVIGVAHRSPNWGRGGQDGNLPVSKLSGKRPLSQNDMPSPGTLNINKPSLAWWSGLFMLIPATREAHCEALRTGKL